VVMKKMSRVELRIQCLAVMSGWWWKMTRVEI
jgi:hypothetical protein